MRLAEFLLERYFAEYEFSIPFLLCTSDCETFQLSEIISLADREALNLWSELRLGYTEPRGHPLLRAEIAKLYGRNIDSDDIVVFAGAEEAIFIFMNALLKRGDHVIVQFPAYQSLYEISKAVGCRVTKWTMNQEANWELDIDTLKRGVNSKTKAVIVNFPHNPTGFLPSKSFFSSISMICEKNNLYFFSDEVYRLLEFRIEDRLPTAFELYDKGVSLGVMSKAFGLAGLRIGWIASHDKLLLSKLAAFKHYTSICNSATSEILALIALRSKGKILGRNLGIIKTNLKILDRFFKDYQDYLSWDRPRAGAVGFPRLNEKFGKVGKFCDNLRLNKGVLLLPSSLYEYDGNNFRIGFGRIGMESALEKLMEYFREFVA